MEMNEFISFTKTESQRLIDYFFDGKKPDNLRYLHLAKLMEEVGELSEAVLASDSLMRKEKDGSQINLEHEFADVMLVTAIMAQDMGVDLEKALEEKIKKIKERTY